MPVYDIKISLKRIASNSDWNGYPDTQVSGYPFQYPLYSIGYGPDALHVNQPTASKQWRVETETNSDTTWKAWQYSGDNCSHRQAAEAVCSLASQALMTLSQSSGLLQLVNWLLSWSTTTAHAKNDITDENIPKYLITKQNAMKRCKTNITWYDIYHQLSVKVRRGIRVGLYILSFCLTSPFLSELLQVRPVSNSKLLVTVVVRKVS